MMDGRKSAVIILNILNGNGVEHIWHEVSDGGHDASSVQPHFYNYLRFIFKTN